MSEYPQHAKLAAVVAHYQADPVATITEFLQWLEDEQGITLCRAADGMDRAAGETGAFVQSFVPADCWPLLFFGVAPVDYELEARGMREEAPDAR